MNGNVSNPVIVVSPAVRAGTTLVQRLLCSASNTLVYGDVVGQEMEFFAKYAAVKERMLGFQESMSEPIRTSVLAGDTDDFIAPLAPSFACHTDGLRKAALAWLEGVAAEAVAVGRPVWGWKLAGADAFALPRLAAWFPQARWVWIDRNIADCFRSAKAAGMARGAEEAATFARGAAAARAAFAPFSERALVLDYRAMLDDPEETIRRLENHTGASGIQASVFGVRVNQTGTAECLPPADLTNEEAVALKVHASEPIIRVA